jgi:hypothetical protein
MKNTTDSTPKQDLDQCAPLVTQPRAGDLVFRRIIKSDAVCGDEPYEFRRAGKIIGIALHPHQLHRDWLRVWGNELFPVVIKQDVSWTHVRSVIRFPDGDKFGFFSRKWKLAWVEAYSK